MTVAILYLLFARERLLQRLQEQWDISELIYDIDEHSNNLFNQRICIWKVLTLFDIVSQQLVYGFWALILLRNQISNWNHVTGRTDPQPTEPISRYSVFLFRLASLLCLFIYLSIYPYLSPTLCDHRRPSERAWIRLHTYIGCDATLATPPSWRWRFLYPRRLSLTHTVQLRVSLG